MLTTTSRTSASTTSPSSQSNHNRQHAPMRNIVRAQSCFVGGSVGTQSQNANHIMLITSPVITKNPPLCSGNNLNLHKNSTMIGLRKLAPNLNLQTPNLNLVASKNPSSNNFNLIALNRNVAPDMINRHISCTNLNAKFTGNMKKSVSLISVLHSNLNLMQMPSNSLSFHHLKNPSSAMIDLEDERQRLKNYRLPHHIVGKKPKRLNLNSNTTTESQSSKNSEITTLTQSNSEIHKIEKIPKNCHSHSPIGSKALETITNCCCRTSCHSFSHVGSSMRCSSFFNTNHCLDISVKNVDRTMTTTTTNDKPPCKFHSDKSCKNFNNFKKFICKNCDCITEATTTANDVAIKANGTQFDSFKEGSFDDQTREICSNHTSLQSNQCHSRCTCNEHKEKTKRRLLHKIKKGENPAPCSSSLSRSPTTKNKNNTNMQNKIGRKMKRKLKQKLHEGKNAEKTPKRYPTPPTPPVVTSTTRSPPQFSQSPNERSESPIESSVVHRLGSHKYPFDVDADSNHSPDQGQGHYSDHEPSHMNKIQEKDQFNSTRTSQRQTEIRTGVKIQNQSHELQKSGLVGENFCLTNNSDFAVSSCNDTRKMRQNISSNQINLQSCDLQFDSVTLHAGPPSRSATPSLSSVASSIHSFTSSSSSSSACVTSATHSLEFNISNHDSTPISTNIEHVQSRLQNVKESRVEVEIVKYHEKNLVGTKNKSHLPIEASKILHIRDANLLIDEKNLLIENGNLHISPCGGVANEIEILKRIGSNALTLESINDEKNWPVSYNHVLYQTKLGQNWRDPSRHRLLHRSRRHRHCCKHRLKHMVNSKNDKNDAIDYTDDENRQDHKINSEKEHKHCRHHIIKSITPKSGNVELSANDLIEYENLVKLVVENLAISNEDENTRHINHKQAGGLSVTTESVTNKSSIGRGTIFARVNYLKRILSSRDLKKLKKKLKKKREKKREKLRKINGDSDTLKVKEKVKAKVKGNREGQIKKTRKVRKT